MLELGGHLRTLRRRPFQSALAVCVLALGLSASVAVFTYINGFSRPFPGVDVQRLVRVFDVRNEDPNGNVSYLDFLDYGALDDAFEGIAAAQPYYAASVRLETTTEVAFLEAVSGGYFNVLGVPMAVGRGLLPADDRPGAAAVAVLSHAWWKRAFGGDPSVIGSTVYLNFRPFTIVGVMSAEFLGTTSDFRPDVWIPIAPFKDRYTSWAGLAEDRDVPLVRVYGRLRRGMAEERALGELRAIAAGLDELYPRQKDPRHLRLGAATWIDPGTRLAERPTVRLMAIAAIVLLLLVCANVANLLLSIAVGRRREMAVRAAVGASPARLIRQVLLENVLLGLAAGGVAVLVAGPASARLGSYFARPSVWGANVAREVVVDLRVLAFAAGISLATGVLAGLLPALRASRRNLQDILRSDVAVRDAGSWRLPGRRIPGVHDALVSTQVALAVVLLIVAGLVLRTLISAGSVHPGFAYDRLIVTHVSTSSTELAISDRRRFFRELAEGVTAEPWVRAATVADYPLLSPHRSAEFRLDGQDDAVSLVYSKVIPGFFRALDVDVVQGRGFLAGDTIGAPDVALVNETLAQRFFPEQHPVGRRLWWSGAVNGAPREFEIVGVVRDTKTQDFLGEVEPAVYLSYPQHEYPTGSALMVAVGGDPRLAVPRLYRWLRDFEPHLAIVNVVTYPEVVRGFLYTQRMNAELFTVLATVGLGLAAVGVSSVTGLAVSRRTREIGIRMSLGAQRREISRLVIGRALRPVAVGLGLGLVGSVPVTRLLRSLLYDVEPGDPLVAVAGTALFVVAALTAAYVPARRAASVDPVQALRHE